MSVIAVRVHDERIELAADSITVQGWTQRKNRAKLIRNSKTNIVVGGVGNSEQTILLGLFAETNRPASASEADMVRYFASFVKHCREWTDDSDFAVDNHFIIAIDGKVFSIQEWCIEEIKDFDAIGAGMDFALAALHLGHSAKEAVETACELSAMCELPVVEIIEVKP